MPQSLANILVHLIFSTKNRAPLIEREIEGELYPYLATICRGCKSPAHAIGGTSDHVHIALTLSRTISVADLLEEIKRSSSKWIKTKEPQFAGFAWQNGYGAFSIGQSQLPALRRYIANQKEHHRRRTFQEEFRNSSSATKSRMMSGMCGTDSCAYYALSGLRASRGNRSPGRCPGLSYFAPLGLGRNAMYDLISPKGAQYGSPGQRPGDASRKNRRSPEGAESLSRPYRVANVVMGSVPRALPWAFLFRPFGARELANETRS